MKTVVKIVAALCLAAVCAGYAYAAHQANEVKYETVVYHEVVRPGDTLNSILEQYYNPYNEKDCWDDWQTKQKARNKRLLFKPDGSPRALRPADIICIEVRERIAR